MAHEMKELIRTFKNFKNYAPFQLIGNMNPGDLHTLEVLRELSEEAPDGKAIVSNLVERMEVPPPAVSRCLKAMEQKGFVLRETNPRDRRQTFVVMTEKGQAEYLLAEQEIRSYMRGIEERMGEQELRRLNEYLRRFTDAAREELEARRTPGEDKVPDSES